MSCVTSPTATQFATITTSSLSTSFSDSVSTLDPTVTTIQSVSCVPTSNGTVTASSCSTTQVVSTIAGGTTTVRVPVVATVPITSSSPTATLFSTSCSDGGATSQNATSAGTSTTTVVLTTTVPTMVTFQSSFTSDGTVVFTSGTSTTIATVETTQTSVVTPTSSPSTSGSSNTSAIVGGAIGGTVGAVVLVLLAWLFLRKRRHYDFDDDLFLRPAVQDEHPSNVLRKNGEKQAVELDAEPRPYTYGALSSAGPSSGPHTPSTEGAPPVAYRGPLPPPRPSPYPTTPGAGLPPSPRPVPVPSQSNLSSPSAYSTAYPSVQPYPQQPYTSPTATTSGSTVYTGVPAGYDAHRPLHVVNDYPPVLPYPAGLAPSSEKAQIYLHPDRGLTTVPERASGSGSSAYLPHRPPTPAGLGSVHPSPPLQSQSQLQQPPQAVPQPDPARGPGPPFVHQDAVRAASPGVRASEGDAPPAYSV